jgi:uncharacterized protein (DUF58 family)
MVTAPPKLTDPFPPKPHVAFAFALALALAFAFAFAFAFALAFALALALALAFAFALALALAFLSSIPSAARNPLLAREASARSCFPTPDEQVPSNAHAKRVPHPNLFLANPKRPNA